MSTRRTQIRRQLKGIARRTATDMITLLEIGREIENDAPNHATDIAAIVEYGELLVKLVEHLDAEF